MDHAPPFRATAHDSARASHRLLAARARLPPDEFVARRTGLFPGLRATLNHILVADRSYVDAMEGGTLGPAAFADPEPCRTVAALREARAEVDRRLPAAVRGLGEAGLGRVVSVHRGTRVQRERMDRLLLHQIHHRGQAHAMLSGTPVPPPQLDEFSSAAETPLWAEELAALGRTETTVWGEPGTGPWRSTAPLGPHPARAQLSTPGGAPC